MTEIKSDLLSLQLMGTFVFVLGEGENAHDVCLFVYCLFVVCVCFVLFYFSRFVALQ